MKELEKEIERVKGVIENYSKDFDKTSSEYKRNILNELITRSNGVLLGLQKAKMILENEVK